jgi:hypothetical protein
MSPPIFPALPGLAYPVKRTPKWSGSRQESLSGKKVRTSFFSYPIWAYTLPFNILRSGSAFLEWQQLAGFINAVNGGTGLWLYNDVNDNSATAQEFGVGDGVTSTFQLVRALGGFIEPVFFPNVITNIEIAGTPTSAYTQGASNPGAITFNSPPANGAALTWTGTFYWGCRFDDDAFDFENFYSQMMRLKALNFSTEKLP